MSQATNFRLTSDTGAKQAHALTPLLTEPEPPQFPFLNLLVSGGHTLLVLATGETQFKILAKSLDDSIGYAIPLSCYSKRKH